MKAFITVVGKDTVGVVARVSGLCSELSINIEDLSHCSVSHEELRGRIDTLAREMEMQVTLTRQEVFDAMHTI